MTEIESHYASSFATLREINGVSVAEIERRARCIEDNKADALWRVRSFEGFLGANESLRECLMLSWLFFSSVSQKKTPDYAGAEIPSFYASAGGISRG